MNIGLEGQASVVIPTPALYQQVGVASHRGTCHMGEVGQTSGSKPGVSYSQGLGAWGTWVGVLDGTCAYRQSPQAVDPCLPARLAARSPPASWARPVVSSEFSQRCWPPPRLSLGHTA